MVYLLNAGARPIEYSVVGSSPSKRQTVIEPGHQQRVLGRAGEGSGWLKIDHDGESGDLIGTAVLESGSHLSRLPLHVLPLKGGAVQEAIRAPVFSASEVAASVFNTTDEAVQIHISLTAPGSPGHAAEASFVLAPFEIQTTRFSTVAAPGGPAVGMGALRVASSKSGVLVQAYSVAPTGEVVELSFLDHASAHSNGSYPLLPVDRYETELTLRNLGDQSSQVVGQVYWNEGTYALGPVLIEPGGIVSLAVDDLIDHGDPDILGRTLLEGMPDAFLKWTVLSGSRHLLGRTEARPRNSSDRVGFNCLGCCWESPWGSVEPAYVSFEPGQSVYFEACINYDTCNGSMGPYLVTPSTTFVPSPFSWNGVQVSAAGASEEVISFLARGEELATTCNATEVIFEGSGKADTCKLLLRKSHNPGQSWSTSVACTNQASNCSQCNSCCNAIKAYWTCKKKHSSIVQSEYNACTGHCLTDHCD